MLPKTQGAQGNMGRCAPAWAYTHTRAGAQTPQRSQNGLGGGDGWEDQAWCQLHAL